MAEQDPASALAPPEGVDRTAIGAALMRAFHLVAEGEPKIFTDEFAMKLTGASEEAIRATRSNVERLAPDGIASSATWVLRSRYTEDCLEATCRSGVRQYVLLGAGLDSYALRHAADPDGPVVFEVDAPKTQEWKRRRIGELGLGLPKNLRFAPCDFEHTSIAEALAGAGFRTEARAFVAWLGVTQYLTREAIDKALQWAASLAPGSQLVLTFCAPLPRMIESSKHISAMAGVNFATFFTPEEMAATLRKAGFARTEHFSPERADAAYFTGRTDAMHAPAGEQLMRAWTK